MIDETRPSDEMTGKVVAKQKAWPNDCVECIRGGRVRMYASEECLDSCKYCLHHDEADPRDDLDAAMELLKEVMLRHEDDLEMSILTPDKWAIRTIQNAGILWELPISGPGLRYGIVRIAAEVMGVEG